MRIKRANNLLFRELMIAIIKSGLEESWINFCVHLAELPVSRTYALEMGWATQHGRSFSWRDWRSEFDALWKGGRSMGENLELQSLAIFPYPFNA
jgi:hypothetical protein